MRSLSFTSFLVYLVSIIPFPVLYLLSDLLYLILYRLIGYRTNVVRENLRNSFPDWSDGQRREIERKFYRYLPDVILEAIKMRTISAKEMQRRFRLNNQEEVVKHLSAGRAIVGVTAHYGNWEWGLHRLSIATDEPVLIIYKPLTNKTFDRLFNEMRIRFGAIMVPMKQTLRQLVKYRHTPHISMFVADQSPRYEESDYFTQFLHQETLVFTGPARVAQRLDAAIVYCHIDRVRRGHYACTFTTLTDRPNDYSVHALTDLHNRFTEDIIKRKPELWMWSHRRWKRKPRQGGGQVTPSVTAGHQA